MPGLLLASDASAAYRAGQIVGACLVPAALFLGILKCASIARRPTTSTWCAYSLLVLLAGWLVAAMAGVLPVLGAPAPAVEVTRVLASAVGLLLILVAMVFAVVGLATFGSTPGLVQGRRQAVATLVVGGLTFLAAAVVAIVAAVQAISAHPSRTGGDWTARTDVQRFEALNFTYAVPPAPYTRWTTSGNKAMTVGFFRGRPAVFFMIIAEQGGDPEATSSTLAEVAQSNMTAGATGRPVFGPLSPHTVNGLSGTRFTADAVVQGSRLTYSYWTYAANGFLYQLITFGAVGDRRRVLEDADRLIARFQVIDPSRPAPGSATLPFTRFESTTYPYALNVREPWKGWPDVQSRNPGAETGALFDTHGGFLVTPFALPGHRPSDAVLVDALLRDWGLDPSAAGASALPAVEAGGMRGAALSFQKTVDGDTYHYRSRVFANERWGLEVTVWTRDGDDLDRLALDVFAGLRIGDSNTPELPAPGSAPAKEHAELFDRIGQAYLSAREFPASVRFFEEAVRLDPQPHTYLLHLIRAFADGGDAAAALALIESTTHPQREHEDVRSWRAWLRKGEGLKAAALADYERLFARVEYRNDEDFTAYTELLADAGRWGDLTAAFDRYVPGGDAVKLRLLQSRWLARAGRHAEGLRVLESLPKTVPFSEEVALAVLRHHQGLENDTRVVALGDDLVRRGFESVAVQYARGDALAGLRRYREAKQAFERALARDPQDADSASYLRDVTSLLAAMDHSLIQEEIEPVPLPAALSARLAAAESRPDPLGWGAFYRHIVDAYRFVPGREHVRTVRHKVKMTDARGVERFSTLEVGFDPGAERLFVNEVLVRDGNGQVVWRAAPGDSSIVVDASAEERRIVYIAVPAAAVGRTVEITFTRRRLIAPDTFPYEPFVFAAIRPVGVRAVSYAGDPALIRHHASASIQTESSDQGASWFLEDGPVAPWEPRRAALTRFAPTLRIAAAGGDWAEMAATYRGELAASLPAEPEVQALAERLTRDRVTRDEKIAALVSHLQTAIAYEGRDIIDGPSARRATAVLKAARGDSREHAVLFLQMLQAIGVVAHPALAGGEVVDRDLPALPQLDHMIVFVAGEGGRGRFYDVTDKDVDPRLHPPLGLGGYPALVLDPAGARFETIPQYADDSSGIRVERRARVGADGTMSVSETVELTGYYASSMRSHLSALAPGARKEWAQARVSRWVRGAELSTLTADGVEGNEEPIRLTLEYDAGLACAAEGAGWNCTLPATWEQEYLEAEVTAVRRTPFAVPYPLGVKAQTTVEAPADWTAAGKAHAALRGGNDAVNWSAVTTATPDAHVGVSFEAALKSGVYGPERYAAFRGMLDQATRAAAAAVSVSPMPPKAAASRHVPSPRP